MTLIDRIPTLASIDIEHEVQTYAAQFTGPQSPGTGSRLVTDCKCEAKRVMAGHVESFAGFASVIEVTVGDTFVFVACDEFGGAWLTRWAAAEGYGFEELFHAGVEINRIASPESIALACGRRIPWTGATSAAKGVQPPPRALGNANNSTTRTIRFVGATA